MPALLGGFFRPMALVFLLCLVCLGVALRLSSIGRLGPAGSLYSVILIWIATIAVWNYSIGTQVGNLEMLDWSLSGILITATCYLIGRLLPLQSKSFNIVLITSLAVMVFLVLVLARDGRFNLRAESLGDEEKVATYQGFARSLAVTAILALALTRHVLIRIAISLAAVAALYINGARSEFVCFIAALLALWSVHAMLDRGRSLPLIALLLGLLLLPFLSIDAIQNALPDNRVLQLLDIAGSTSAIGRAELSREGWAEIQANPMFGNYGFYYNTGGVGSYPHSLLAAWVNLGVVGFILYVALFGIMIRMQCSTLSGARLTDPVASAALLTVVFSGVALLFAKEYSYMVTAFAVAFTDRAWSEIHCDTGDLLSNKQDAACL